MQPYEIVHTLFKNSGCVPPFRLLRGSQPRGGFSPAALPRSVGTDPHYSAHGKSGSAGREPV